jgi:hypothetical protein
MRSHAEPKLVGPATTNAALTGGIRIRMAAGAAAICALVAFAYGACSSSAASGGEDATGVLARHNHLHSACQRRHGKTILRRGVVRVFKTSGAVYGCVEGSPRIVALEGSIKQVAGRFLAVEESQSDQYGFEASLAVVDLRSGRSYSVASLSQPMWGEASGEPPTPGPWPLEAFALGSDGRTARLYATFSTHPNPGDNASPSGQVLDLIGFHRLRRRLAVSGPGEIAATSLSYRDHTVTWTQNGAPRSAGS